MSKSQILSNILYHMEYSSDYTGGSARYPTFSIAYLVYSTSQRSILNSYIGDAIGDRGKTRARHDTSKVRYFARLCSVGCVHERTRGIYPTLLRVQ